MFLYQTIKTRKEMREDFIIPKLLTPDQIDETTKVEVWATSFQDNCDDFCELKFFKANDTHPFLIKRVNGY